MRKIKLMALLLATLMIVSAFAGCAGVKKEELDALDVRVQALEDLLNGQQKSLEEIKNDLKAGDDYSEVLDAIESIKTDLEDKIKDVNGRIDTEVGKVDTPTASVSDETKAAQQKALALIEVRRAEFNKAAGDYAEDDYVKISEALGTATGAVNAATTVDAVNAAMAALDAELDKYMSYAMKAYDYYTQLLGGITEDAEELVDEAKAFLKTVKAVYDADEKVEFVGKLNRASSPEVDEYVAELAYLVSEGTKADKDEYIDVYSAIDDLCTLFSAKTGTKEIPYVEDGKIRYADLKTLSQYVDEADKLVEDIEDTIGENLLYGTSEFNAFGTLYNQYEKFAEEAVLLGGDALVALVTNADDFNAAEDTYKLIKEAYDEYDNATRISAGTYGDVFYYYTELVNNNADELLEWNKSAKETIWVAEYYAMVEDALESWKTEYELSPENVEKIIEAKEGTYFYNKKPSSGTAPDPYVLDKLHNDLLVTAYNQFKDEIAPKILELNDVDEASISAVLAYDEVEELFADLVVLQKATTDRDVKYPNNVALSLDKANFKTIVEDADIFDDYATERLNLAFASSVTMNSFLAPNGLLNLYTFEADIDELDDKAPATTGTSTRTEYHYYKDFNKDGSVATSYYTDDNGTPTNTADDIAVTVIEDGRSLGEIYNFFNVKYGTIKNLSKEINKQIAALEDNVEAFNISSNLAFVKLEGKYVEISGNMTFTSNGELFDATKDVNGTEAGTGVYVALEDVEWNNPAYATNKAAREAYLTGLAGSTSTVTIEAFMFEYPEFKDMLDLDEFEAAKKAMEERMVSLFALADQFVDELDAVEYVRNTTRNTAKIFKDGYVSGTYDPKYDNGKLDKDSLGNPIEDIDTVATAALSNLVSLEDKASVEVAYTTYDKWAKQGGWLEQEIFATYSDTNNDYDDVYFMKGFDPNAYADVKYSTEMVTKLKNQIETIERTATNFVNTVKNIQAVDAVNPFVVNKYSAQNHLSNNLPSASSDPSKVRNYFAWTKFERRSDEYNRYDGTYTYVKTNGTETASVSVSTGTKGDSDANVVSQMSFTTKKDLINRAMVLYTGFHDSHIEYVPDANNNYATGNTVYYYATEYVPYEAFDNAVADYTKYELLNVKSYLYDQLSDTDPVQKKLEDAIATADSVQVVENLLVSRVGEAGINIANLITLSALKARSVLHDFERITAALPVGTP